MVELDHGVVPAFVPLIERPIASRYGLLGDGHWKNELKVAQPDDNIISARFEFRRLRHEQRHTLSHTHTPPKSIRQQGSAPLIEGRFNPFSVNAKLAIHSIQNARVPLFARVGPEDGRFPGHPITAEKSLAATNSAVVGARRAQRPADAQGMSLTHSGGEQ